MFLVVFDNGGTLIFDPFSETVSRIRSTNLYSKVLSVCSEIDQSMVNRILDQWKVENATFDFPFASHFLQEEVWVTRALTKVLANFDVKFLDFIPVLAPALLNEYRKEVRSVIGKQSHIPLIRDSLQALSGQDVVLAVASNDREFATSTMLSWAGLRQYFDFVITSEGLSDENSFIQKPSPDFYRLLEDKIYQATGQIFSQKIHIGDNERNDVEAPAGLGYITVRYVNSNNLADIKWLDHRLHTQADYKYQDPAELKHLLLKILNQKIQR